MTNPPHVDASMSKQQIVDTLAQHLLAQGFQIEEIDAKRPWGAFIRVANAQADQFVNAYFGDMEVPENAKHGERSPKFLIVGPHHRLSWQHHDRRSEFWRLIGGQAGVKSSRTNAQPDEVHVFKLGEAMELPRGMRHRLVGLDDWGVVAEIWIHDDPHRPSDESDIHRHDDDYSR